MRSSLRPSLPPSDGTTVWPTRREGLSQGHSGTGRVPAGTSPCQPLPVAHRRDHRRRFRASPSPARPDDLITHPAASIGNGSFSLSGVPTEIRELGGYDRAGGKDVDEDEGLPSLEPGAGGVRATLTPIAKDTTAQMIATIRTCRGESALPDICQATPEASSMLRCRSISRRRAKTIPARVKQRKRLTPIPTVKSDCEGVIRALQTPVAAKMAEK